MTTTPPRKPRPPKAKPTGEPGPNQAALNRKQGIVNDLQGDHNDAVDEALAAPATTEERQDIAEAVAAATTERHDAEHEAQAEMNAEVAAADAQRTAEFDAQATTNAAQATTNAAALEALKAVGAAATKVTDLLEESANRTRRWTIRLAAVVLVIAVLATLGYWRLKSLSDDGVRERNANTAAAAQAKVQAHRFCVDQGRRDAQVKMELTFLVNTAIGPHNASLPLRKFKANYPAHLNAKIPPVVCAP